MALNFALNTAAAFDSMTLTPRTVGTNPTSVQAYRDTSGVVWCFEADSGSSTISFFPISGTDGVINATTITTSTRTTRTVGTTPLSVQVYRDTSGVVWCVSADSGSNRNSFFSISGTDGVINATTITTSTLTPRTVGTSPRTVQVYRDTSGVIWIASAELSSGRVSFYEISGTDGVINATTITTSTLTPRTVASNTTSAIFYRDTSGVVWCVACNQNSNGLSIFPTSGTDGVINATTITTSTQSSRSATSNTVANIYRDASGVVWAVGIIISNNTFYVWPISGTDGVINATLMTGSTITPRVIGSSPNSAFIYTDQATGVIWFATVEATGIVSLRPVSATNGITTTTLLSNAPRTARTVGSSAASNFVYRDAVNVYWSISSVSGNSIAIFPLSGPPASLPAINPALVYSTSDLLSSYFAKSSGLAEIHISLLAIELIAGIQGSSTDASFFVFNRTFNFGYSGTLSNPSGTLASGNQLRLTTSTADISETTITLASGSTFRLGKKAGPYTVGLVSQSGSTIEVFPDADRSGSPLNLRNQSIASGTTINVTSGTATVLVNSVAGITAGSGVTLQELQTQVAAAKFANGTRVQVAHRQIFSIASTAINTTTDVLTLGNDSNSDAANFRTTSPNTLIRFSLASGATLPTSTPQIFDGGLYYWKSGGQLSITEGGTAINFSTQGSGNFVLIAETEIDNSVVSGGAGYAFALTRSNNAQIRVKAVHWANPSSTASCSIFYDQVFAWSATAGISILDTVSNAVVAAQDPIHEQLISITSISLEGPVIDATGATITVITLPNDGSAITAYSLALEGTGRIQINSNDTDGVTSWQELYLWGCYVRSTAGGIRLASASTIVANSIFNFTFANLEFDNTSSTPLAIVGGIGRSANGSNPVAITTTGSIAVNAVSQGTGALVTAGGGSFNPAVDSVIVGSIQANAITASAIATNAIDADALATDAVSEIWNAGTRTLTAGTNIALAKGVGITGLNDITAADVWAAGTRSLTDKVGFSLSQAFPTNFSALAITGGGAVTAGTVSDKTGYSLTGTQTFNLTGNISGSVGSVTSAITLPTIPTDWLSAAGVSAAAVTKIQTGLSTYAGGDTSGTTTLLSRLTNTRAGLLDNLDAAISSRSTYAGGDTSGTTTLLSRLTNTRAGLLDNLDAAISSRSTYAGADTAGTTTLLSRVTGAVLLASNYTAPPTAADIWAYSGGRTVTGFSAGAINAAAIADGALTSVKFGGGVLLTQQSVRDALAGLAATTSPVAGSIDANLSNIFAVAAS